MSLPTFIVELLDPGKHRREEFDCGVELLTTFLRKRANQESKALALACYVMVPDDDPGRIAGYYTLSAAAIKTVELPPAIAKRLPRYPLLPATLLGRLARDLAFRGLGVGDRLMISALRRAYESSHQIGSVAVITDPKDEAAGKFYTDFNFLALNEKRMFLPMAEIPQILAVPEVG